MKILWPETAVWVQVPLAVPRVNVKRDECPQIYLKGTAMGLTKKVPSLVFFTRVLRGTYVESPTRGTVSGRIGKTNRFCLFFCLPECCGGTYVESPTRDTESKCEKR